MDTMDMGLVSSVVLAALLVLGLWAVRELSRRAEAHTELQALAAWKQHGRSVFGKFPRASVQAQLIWTRLAQREVEEADKRVCSWCGRTGVPFHVDGITMLNGDKRHWYCSNRCYRSGHGSEAI